MILSRTNTTTDGSGYLEADAHAIPTVQISYTDVTALRKWLKEGTGHTASITETETKLMPALADVVGYFSSRGENQIVPGILKPSITAPGRAIFAAYYEDYSAAEQDYDLLQGTSMASPHIAGAGVLIKALHPTWSPMQIQTALMTTAETDVVIEDGETQAGPFDMGAGRVDLTQAVRAALLLDEDAADFKAADPDQDGDPRTLNLASFGNGTCVTKCQWQRTVTNAADFDTQWSASTGERVTVTPDSFVLNAGQSQQLTVTADLTDIAIGDWFFDQVVLASSSGVPDARLPLAVKSAISELPEGVVIDAAQESDTVTLEKLKAIEITAGQVSVTGLAKSSVSTGELVSDPTKDDPFDGDFDPAKDGAQFFTVDIPQDATRFVAEITKSASGDLDLFIGTGDKPSADTLVLSASTVSALEYAELLAPEAGKYWVLVQNFEAGHSTAQAFTLHIGVVEGDAGNNIGARCHASDVFGNGEATGGRQRRTINNIAGRGTGGMRTMAIEIARRRLCVNK